jgi:DegV family protein with EDD domain
MRSQVAIFREGGKEENMPLRVVTDSNCDLPPDVIREYGITVVPLYINIGTDSYLDGVDMSRKDFYEGLPDFANHPTTSVPGPGMFVDAYDRLAAEGATEILCIHISMTLSAVANSARLAMEELQTDPLREHKPLIEIIDSGNLTLGTGLLVLTAAQAAQEGKSMQEIAARLDDQLSRTYCFAALDTLEFLRRSGRLTRFQSSLGSMLQVKPILKMHASEMAMERVRTRSKSVGRVIELVEDLGSLEDLAVVHTHDLERAKALREQAKHLFPDGTSAMFAEVTPVIGAHIGPGAVGFVAITKGDLP